ncbi:MULTISPECIES: hypothetical protein [unclassified Streptomyces]|uniref:hypothetical protein n=1 Tax=unclassified Streptomyces TaxID=2593676 RepID=UPI00115F8919|nr:MULTISPECIES: hypothetical protein [unclassified Streptomyces]
MSPWESLANLDRLTVEESPEALHAEVFQELYGDAATHRDLEELWRDEAFMGEEGTHSLLDIDRVAPTTGAPASHDVADYGT